MADRKYNRVLVLGGTGFLGYYALRALDEANFQMAIMLHRKKDDLDIPFEGYEVFEGDVLKLDTLRIAIEKFKPDVIVNMVGSLTKKPGRSLEKLFVEGIRNVIETAERGGVKKIVYISDLAVKNDKNTLYIKARREAEKIIQNSSLQWTILRPSVMFGWKANFTNIFVKQINKPGPVLVLSDKYKLQPVSASTTAFCVAAASIGNLGNSKIYEVVGPEVLTSSQMVDRLKSILNSDRKIWVVPLICLKLLRFLKKFGFPTLVSRFHIHVFENATIGDASQIKRDFNIKEVYFDPASEEDSLY